jgi:hypothetical protein
MADDKRQEANERLKRFRTMSLDDVAVEAAINPGSVHSQAGEGVDLLEKGLGCTLPE